MTAGIAVVEPASGRLESLFVGAVAAAIAIGAGAIVQMRQVEDGQQRLLDWQISAFDDLDPVDQGIYNALLAASEELWWAHGDILMFGTEDEKADPWPTVQALDEIHLMPPFVRDIAWERQGEVQWQRIASFSFEGSTVYFGSQGHSPGQSAYLLMLSHIHKGASYADGASIWLHPDANVPPPETIKRDSLIVNGWKEIVPYSGAMEVERLKGG